MWPPLFCVAAAGPSLGCDRQLQGPAGLRVISRVNSPALLKPIGTSATISSCTCNTI
jgi:hypothetical protein